MILQTSAGSNQEYHCATNVPYVHIGVVTIQALSCPVSTPLQGLPVHEHALQDPKKCSLSAAPWSPEAPSALRRSSPSIIFFARRVWRTSAWPSRENRMSSDADYHYYQGWQCGSTYRARWMGGRRIFPHHSNNGFIVIKSAAQIHTYVCEWQSSFGPGDRWGLRWGQ